MPIIKLQQAIRTLQPGQTAEIFCTDPGAEQDLTSWCKVNRHTLSDAQLYNEKGTKVWRFLIIKSSSNK